MFDISWTEFLLIGVVALIVIGPKELPAVLRTLGQWTRRLRSMAADFQNQFQEAMREAEMADLKKQVDDIAHDIKNYDPLQDVRTDVEAAARTFESSLEKPAESRGGNVASRNPRRNGVTAMRRHRRQDRSRRKRRSKRAAESAATAPATEGGESHRRRRRDRSGRAGGSRRSPPPGQH